MKMKVRTMFGKKAAVAVCAAMVISAGTINTFASMKMAGNLVKNDNGVVSYSDDGGETWQEGAPEGFTQEFGDDGSIRSYVGNPPDGGATSFAIRNENGITSYSTDDGQTWSEETPEGYIENEDGSVGYRVFGELGGQLESGFHWNAEEMPAGGEFFSGFSGNGGSMMIRNENGAVSYSTDGGQTWQDGMPEGYNQEVGEDGSVRSFFGTIPDVNGEAFFDTFFNGNGENSIEASSTPNGI